MSESVEDNVSEEVIEVRAIVKGRVQGVGFRATAKIHACRLGIVGSVRNLADGSVEIYAQGKKSAIDQLMDSLQKEFKGYVSKISFQEISTQKSHYDGFQIVHN